MSLDKQGKVKSALSADGGLKLTIKREKTIDDARVPEWVTEARGHGVGKLVIKRKAAAAGSVHKSPDTAGVQTEHRPNGPILRLSVTSSTSGDGSRHAHVKCWSLCDVPPVVDDVPSVSELSPACQLQSSPKDSGIDMSSPPHDDGTVGVETNPATGIWSAAECAADSSPVELEKAASETTVTSFDADSVVPSSSKTVWSKAGSHSCGSNPSKVQSTLRSQRERSALRAIGGTSQKLVNPLAKSHRVGRYQHMLPVNRIRAESNIGRRSSLEESPTYNMVASRTRSFKPLPRVRTKLKLLSNNTYAPVFDEGEAINEHAVSTETSKLLGITKPPSLDTERRRNRRFCKSFKLDTFENVKVKLCYSNNEHNSVNGETVQKLPKLKLVVKSEPKMSVSCIKQQMDDVSVTAEQMSVKQTRSHKSKASVNSSTDDQAHCGIDSFNAKHLLSSKSEDSRTGRPKRKHLKAKQVDDEETVGKKSRLQPHPTECTVGQLQDGSDSRQSSDKDHVDGTLKSGCCNATADDAARDTKVTLSSVHTDKLTTEIKLCRASDKEQPAVLEEAESTSVAEIRPSEHPAKSESNGAHASYSSTVNSGVERHWSKNSSFDSEKCAELNLSDTDADAGRCKVDWQLCQLDDKSVDESVNEEIRTTELQNSSSDCSSAHNDLPVALITTRNSRVPTTNICLDSRPVEDTADDHSGETNYTCAIFKDSGMFSTAGQPSTLSTDTDVLMANVDSVTPNTNCINSASMELLDTDSSTVTEAHDDNMPMTLKPAGDSSSCQAVYSQNDATDDISSVDSAKLHFDNTDCWQDIRHRSIETKASCEENLESKSLCFLPEELQNFAGEGKQLEDDSMPSSLLPLSPLCCSQEHKEAAAAAAATIASSNGFLAAFTQFVQKAGAKRQPANCSTTETDSTSESEEKRMPNSLCSQKSIRQRPFSSYKRGHTSSEKQASPENRLPVHFSEFESKVESACIEETCLLEAGSSAEIALKEEMLTAQNVTIDCSRAHTITNKPCMPSSGTHAYSGPDEDITSQSADKITAKSGSRQKFVRQKTSSSYRQRHIDSEKHTSSKNKIRCRLSQSENRVETVSAAVTCSLKTDCLAEIAVKPKMLTAQNSTSDCSSARSSVVAAVADKLCSMSSVVCADTSHAAEKTVVASGSSPKFDRQKPFCSHRWRHTSSEKQTASQNRVPRQLSQSEDTVETVSVRETALPETGTSELIATQKELLTVQQQNSTSEVTPDIVNKLCVLSSSTCTDSGLSKESTEKTVLLKSGCGQKSVRQKLFSARQQQRTRSGKHATSEDTLPCGLSTSESTVETESIKEKSSLLMSNSTDVAVQNARSTARQNNSNNEVAAVTTDKPCMLSTSSLAVSGPNIPSQSRSVDRSVRQRPFSSHKQRHRFSEKQNSSDSRMPCHRSDSESKGESVSFIETALLDRSAEIEYSERLTCTTVDERPLLSKDELSNIVSADCRLVALRHRVCELIETLFPALQFPPTCQRDSASVERFVKDITDVLSNSVTDTQDIRQCTDPVVTLHHMPDQCLQSLQQQIMRLLSLILPDTDLSVISTDSLDVLLELVTSFNRPFPRTSSASYPEPCRSQETSPRLSDTLYLHRQPLSLCVADESVVRTESHLSAADAFFSIPNGLMQLGSPGPTGDKRSIRRQVKDCLMLLDRDLT